MEQMLIDFLMTGNLIKLGIVIIITYFLLQFISDRSQTQWRKNTLKAIKNKNKNIIE